MGWKDIIILSVMLSIMPDGYHMGWDGGWGCLNVMAAILQTPQVKKVYRILNIIQQQCFTKTDAQNESQTAFFSRKDTIYRFSYSFFLVPL